MIEMTHIKQLLRQIDYKRLKPFLLDRRFLSVYVAALIIILFMMWAVGRRDFAVQLSLVLVALSIGAFISEYDEKGAGKLAERLMNLMSGFGIKGEDAQYDERGVPVVSLRGLGEIHYNPTAVAMNGFRYYDLWKTSGNRENFHKFVNCADSLVDHLTICKGDEYDYGIWEYHYPWSYNLQPPWVSGLAQGVGVQLLSRAWKVTGETKYLTKASAALKAFFVNALRGGVTYKDGPDEWWYEEYVGAGAQESRVLNGMIYALIGINEYGINSGDERADLLFGKGVNSLVKRLNQFDSGWWTYYDALGLIATRSYHNVHLELIQKMHEITKNNVFRDTFTRWSGYRCHFFIREFVRQDPSWHDLIILFINAFGAFCFAELIYWIVRIA